MDSFPDLMLRPESARREDLVTDVCMPLVADRGLHALTLQAAAGLCGCSRQAVQQWFGGQAQLRRVFATCFIARWRRWVPARLRAHGLIGLLPESHHVQVWCRVRLALLEHGHREQWLEELVAFLLEEERDAVADLVADPSLALAAHAMITGMTLSPLPGVQPSEVLDFSLLARKQGEIGPSPTTPEVTPVT